MHISLKAEIVGHLFGIPISNSLLLSLISAILLLGVGFFVWRSIKLVPGSFQNGVETVVEGTLGFFSQALGSESQARTFFPLVASFFLFILLNNWLGILPGIGSVGIQEIHDGKEEFVPLFRAAGADLNTTLALAFISVVAAQIYGIRKLGFLSHAGKYFAFTKGPIQLFVGLLELVGEFAKVLSFSFRLFGNIFAGEVLLIIIMALVPFLIPVPFFFLEIFVGFIQAFIFAMLTLVFMKIATETAEH